jgi:hypothetical protein
MDLRTKAKMQATRARFGGECGNYTLRATAPAVRSATPAADVRVAKRSWCLMGRRSRLRGGAFRPDADQPQAKKHGRYNDEPDHKPGPSSKGRRAGGDALVLNTFHQACGMTTGYNRRAQSTSTFSPVSMYGGYPSGDRCGAQGVDVFARPSDCGVQRAGCHAQYR